MKNVIALFKIEREFYKTEKVISGYDTIVM